MGAGLGVGAELCVGAGVGNKFALKRESLEPWDGVSAGSQTSKVVTIYSTGDTHISLSQSPWPLLRKSTT